MRNDRLRLLELGGPARQAGPPSRSLDTRSDSQHDRDRIIYTDAFRRLAGATQVVGAIEGHIFLNRLVQVTMGFLQRLLWRYMIHNPRLASQQRGQREIVRYLFAVFHEAAESEKERALIPPLFDRQVKAIDAPPPGETLPRAARVARLAADVVASLTDSQAVRLYRRLRGTDPGFVTELPVGQ